MKTMKAVAMAFIALGIATGAQAQQPGKFSLELRGGAALPTEKLGANDTKTGLNFDLTAQLQVMPHLALYAGGDWAQMSLKQQIGDYKDALDSGWAFGAKFYAPSYGRVTPFVRAGGVYDHVELEGDKANDVYVGSKHVMGWEAGAGFAVALNNTFSIQPGARYRSFSPKLDELNGKVDFRYVAVDLGVSATFGGKSMAAIRHID